MPRLLTLALLLVLGCAGDGAPAADAALRVESARAVLTADAGAVYLTVVNPGAHADRLLAVETEAADAAELHESRDDGGVMRMVAHPQGFAVPAGGRLILEPGGKHVMLVRPRPAGRSVSLRLIFEHAGAVEVAAARDETMAGMAHGGH